MDDRSCPAPEPHVWTHDKIRADMQETIEAAMAAIKTKYDVGDASAYTILIQASIDGHVNVRETAVRILTEGVNAAGPLSG